MRRHSHRQAGFRNGTEMPLFGQTECQGSETEAGAGAGAGAFPAGCRPQSLSVPAWRGSAPV